MSAIPFDPPRLRIRGPALRRALIAGARRVIAQREALNKINVFPVPDGDTGSNLAFTLGSVLTGALSRRTAGAGELLRKVGEDAIDGARGNSGAILAQFFTGVAEATGSEAAIAPGSLAQAIRAGASSARGALADPKEGTILSVITAFAESLESRAGITDVRTWYATALEQARRALANTPNQLPVLMKAGVVDAGAQGFVDMLEGIGDFMATGLLDIAALEDQGRGDLEAAQGHGEILEADPEHRWCSECLLLGEGLDRPGLRAAVTDLGASCVVVAGSHSRIRLHAHVANPQALFDVAARFGRVESTKADDMHAQARTAAGGGTVAVITDSSADLPAGVAERLNIHVVPLRLNFGDQDYLDKIGLTPAEFYRKLREEIVLPRTSQPSPGDFRRQFEFLLSHHPSLVYLGVSRAVSGTIQSAETAVQRGHPDRSFVFDTANAAGGQALLVIARRGSGAARAKPDRYRCAAGATAAADTDLGHRPRHHPCRAWRARAGLGQAGGAGPGLHPDRQGQAGGPTGDRRRLVRQAPRPGTLRGLCCAPGRLRPSLAVDRRALRRTRRWRNPARRTDAAPGLPGCLARRYRSGDRCPCRARRPGGQSAAGGCLIARWLADFRR